METWDERVAALWAVADDLAPEEFIAKVKALAAERPSNDARALFTIASAHDSVGEEQRAADTYAKAFAAGLPADLRRRASIQYASTLRNLGRLEESVRLLSAERTAGSDELDDAVAAFLALSLVDSGRGREAVGLVLGALARHLPRYNRSLAAYAKDLMPETL
jgi:hypothetical protein